MKLTIEIDVDTDSWPECPPYIYSAKMGSVELGAYFSEFLESCICEEVEAMLKARKEEGGYAG